jgi:hypothetical protein
VAATCFTVALDSTAITANIADIAGEYGVREEGSLLVITTFVLGFGIGPMALALLSCILKNSFQ